MESMFYIYKYIDPHTDDCLYIGKTSDLCRRHSSHLSNKKEYWCNRDLRLEYIKLPDKLNMDFYETYLINKLSPKYNKSSKGAMNIDYINFSYKEEFKEYSKEDFKNELSEKNKGLYINCNINKDMINMFQKIQQKHNWKCSYDKHMKRLKLTYKVKAEDLAEYRLSGQVLNVNFNLIGYIGGSNVVYFDWAHFVKDRIYEIYLVFNLDFLISLEKKVLDPQSEMKELNAYVNEILAIVGINRSWNSLYKLFLDI